MHASERVKNIKEISSELSKEEWFLIDLTLKQFGLPWADQWGSSKESYVIEMISEAEDGLLLELAKHLGIASQLESSKEPEFWSGTEARVFLSHLAAMKVQIAQLKNELKEYGIISFVAHEDIEPTKEWQSEIESALSTMDALIALLAPGFKESNWCDQEVGVAIGRRLPVISVRVGLDPYGFIGKYQALQGAGKDMPTLAREIFDLLLQSPLIGPKITAALVKMLSESYSFAESKRVLGLIEKSKYLNAKHASAMKDAISSNSQVGFSWGVPDQILKIAAGVVS